MCFNARLTPQLMGLFMNKNKKLNLFSLLLLSFLSVNSQADSSNISDIQRTAAVKATVKNNKLCTQLGDFYWEIGDKNGVLGSGKRGFFFGRNTLYQLASSSKFPFIAYLLEKKIKEPTPEQLPYMQMSSGYSGYNPGYCIFASTVSGCFHLWEADTRNDPQVGLFNYSDGHDNKLAIDLGMGSYSIFSLTRELRSTLGNDTGFFYSIPDVVGGLNATAAGYAKFLQNLLSQKYRLYNFLGTHPICTYPKACSTAVRSPLKENWHYSLNHWVEDDPVNGDGAFSSVGLYGFYPWISADKKLYGILARSGLPELSAWPSVKCGRSLRKAWVTGEEVVYQP